MAKLTLLLACVTLGFFGSTKSASFECKFDTRGWGTLGSVYRCDVQNSVSITSSDEAQIDSVFGTHTTGYNNDNVEVISVYSKGQIHYFPRGLDKIFKNLKGIEIFGKGLKEIHQSDFKVFPNLKNLYLSSNNFEILDENLFEFNPNLDSISLSHNKISHIDPNVFDKLTKLNDLFLRTNTCINMNAYNNPTDVQNIIRNAKSQCTNSDYSKLEQKVKNLEAESKNLNSEKFKKSFENLENEVKNSKFSDFFQQRLNSIFDAKSEQIEKAQREVPDKIDKLDEKLSKEILNLKNNVLTVKNAQPANIQKLDRIENLVEDQSQKIESKFTTIDAKLVDVKAEVLKNNQKIQELSQQITKIDETASKNNNNTTATSKDIEASSSQSLAAIMNFIENLSKKMEAIENKLAEMDSIQKEKQDQTMEKISKMKLDIYDNKVEMNEKFNAILSRI